MRELGLELGKDYEAVTVSIDPKDTPGPEPGAAPPPPAGHGQAGDGPLALPHRAPRRTSTSSPTRWASSTSTTTEHEAVRPPRGGAPCSPRRASISRYLYGTSLPRQGPEAGVARGGRRSGGTSFDRVVLSCFKYDPATRRYGFYVFGFIRTGGRWLVFGALATMLIYFWRRELKKGAASMSDLANNILFLPERASTFAERVDHPALLRHRRDDGDVRGAWASRRSSCSSATGGAWPTRRPSTWCPT